MENIPRARRLRRNQTPEEGLVWSRLRRKQQLGCKFRRQHPVGPYIVDFACVARSLIVELDGGHHGDDEESPYDEQRSQYLAAHGFRVIRFSNLQVRVDLDRVLRRIRRELVAG